MMNTIITAFWDHRLPAAGTGTGKAGFGFAPFVLYQCVTHGISIWVEATAMLAAARLFSLMEIGAQRGQHWLVLLLFIFGVSGKPDRRLSGRLQSLSGAVISSDRTRVAQCPHQSMPCGLD